VEERVVEDEWSEGDSDRTATVEGGPPRFDLVSVPHRSRERSEEDTDVEGLAAWAGRTLDQRYRLKRAIGFGATATVFEAEHLTLGRTVAVKVLPYAGNGSQARQRLAREARILSSLQHPNIVQVLDFVRAGPGADFLVMEYLHGRTLKEAERSQVVKQWPWIRDAALQILRALEVAHERGIVHRDIKPSNCFCVDFDEREVKPTIKLLDFGVSKCEQSSALTVSGAILGTVLYMAPEQARGGHVDGRADLYSVGVLLYEMVTGVLPFAGAGFLDVMWRHVYTEPARPQDANPNVRIPQALEALILRALHKNPDRRFASARAFAEALEQVEDEGIVCAGPSSGTRAASAEVPGSTPAEPRAAGGDPTLDDSSERIDDASADLRIVLENAANSWLHGHGPATGLEEVRLRQHRTLEPADVDSFWPRRVAGVENAAHAVLPADAPVTNIYRDAGGRVLILGGAGSGKTHSLLEIAAALHARASSVQNPAAVPLLFDLASWLPDEVPLRRFLATQMHREHRIPAATARAWLAKGKVVPLLEGLDRLPHEQRAAAVEAINTFLLQDDPPGIVVTCRSQTYRGLSKRLQVHAAIELHELDVARIAQTLAEHGPKWQPLVAVLQQSPSLLDLVRTPLGFCVTASVATSEDGIAQLQQAHPHEMGGVYDVYTEQLLRRRRQSLEIRPVLRAVTQLAEDMLRFGANTYRDEVIAPAWLGRTMSQWAYVAGSRALVSFLLGASYILAIGQTPLDNNGLETSLGFGLRFGLSVALGLFGAHALVAVLMFARSGSLHTPSPWLRWIVAFAGSTAMSAALIGAWTTHAPLMALSACGFSSAVLCLRLGAELERDDITLVDEVRWSTQMLRKRAPWIFGGSLAVGLFTGARESVFEGALHALVGIGVGVALAGIRRVPTAAEDGGRSSIGRMGRRAIRAGLLAFALVFAVFAPTYGVAYGVDAALPIAITIGLWFGGVGWIYHRFLRLLLRKERAYVADPSLLDAAAHVGLLDKRPDGYRFFHLSFAEYFASKRTDEHATRHGAAQAFRDRVSSGPEQHPSS